MNRLSETFDRLSVPSFIRPALTEAIEDHVAARLASVKALADEWEAVTLAPLTDDDQPDGVRLRARSREAMYRWLARELRAVLGSDAHTEPCDPDCEAGQHTTQEDK